MKIRTDFVSNSSSSSFVLWGVCFDKDELEQKLRDAGVITADNLNEEDYCSNFDQWLDEQQDFDYDEYASGCCEVVFGLSPSEMKDNETLKQFKQRIFDKLAAAKLPVGSIADIKLHKGVNSDGEIEFD